MQSTKALLIQEPSNIYQEDKTYNTANAPDPEPQHYTLTAAKADQNAAEKGIHDQQAKRATAASGAAVQEPLRGWRLSGVLFRRAEVVGHLSNLPSCRTKRP